MSRYIATRAVRGANALVIEAEFMLKKALSEKGPDTPIEFPNTAYYLPLIYGMTGLEMTKLGNLTKALETARELLSYVPSQKRWTPYLGETLDSGMATLIAAEVIEAIRFVYGLQPERYPGIELTGGTAYPDLDNGSSLTGHLNGPIDDIQLRSWGIQLVDGRMPGFAAIVGAAKSNEVAVKIVRELQQRNILVFLSGNVNGRSIIDQLEEEGVELGYDTYTIPFGTDTISAIYALGFATRSALTFGGLKAGQARDILEYNRDRVFAFVLALGEVDDLKYAAAAGAINFGFPVIADTVIPEILPTGITTYEHVVSMPFDEIEAEDDLARANKLVQKCIEVRGVKIKITDVPVPVPYGSAFEGEVVRRADMRVEFGGKYSRAFEYLFMADMEEIVDGKIEVVGAGFEDLEEGEAMDLGMVIQVAGREMEEDFEPVLERQIHDFINGASGLQHIGQRDIVWMRISKAAAEKGFDLEHLGKIIHARLHADFGTVLDKVQVTIYTEKEDVDAWLEKARKTYDYRNKRLADMIDTSVEEFYSCTLCQSFAPDHVCVVSPERLGLCGAYNWLDCKASFNIDPTGPNQPIDLGECYDEEIGYWEGTIDYTKTASHGVVEKVSMYSIMENPMTACGCFEAILMYIPEVEGVIVVSREDTGMTPMGMKFSTLAGMAGGGVQTPGVMGIGKYYMLSPKFISADGGFKRVVWMSKNLKESMGMELQAVAEREGIPDLVNRIADGDSVTSVEELQEWIKTHDHPVLDMGTMQREEKDLDITEEAEAEEEDVIAQAEAVIERAAEEEPAAEAAPEPEPAPPAPSQEVAPPPSEGQPPATISPARADKAVNMLRRALAAALAELGGLDGLDLEGVQPTAAPPAPPQVVEPEPEPEKPVQELTPDKDWLGEQTKTEIAKEDWDGAVRAITLGATEAEGGTRSHTVTIGGETAMPFMHFEGEMPHKPVVAIEIADRRPDDWADALVETWGDVMDDPGEWAKAAEKAGADVLYLKLSLTDADGNPTTTEQAVEAVDKVLKASGLPLIVFGPGQPDPDNQLLVEISNKFKGERLLLGALEEKNYRTIAASAMADDQLVVPRTAMDVNLAKQLNILITDMGLPAENIVMDPTTGALGYGFEYGYSVMERLRIAALQGDKMTQYPMLVTPGEECWKTKESKVGDDVPEAWGDWETRALAWEAATSIMLIESGADLVVLRHPESVRRTKEAIADLMGE
ncbi:MAG: Carbon monoxide dehydrogenase/acetyl-CoA synthase subunit alpha [Chloroflexi bacterium]|nr:Carbon monoxide dehydrogenase/acetyl-CoA synthase subunit alpha [Chloroflexota bacterium]